MLSYRLCKAILGPFKVNIGALKGRPHLYQCFLIAVVNTCQKLCLVGHCVRHPSSMVEHLIG